MSTARADRKLPARGRGTAGDTSAPLQTRRSVIILICAPPRDNGACGARHVHQERKIGRIGCALAALLLAGHAVGASKSAEPPPLASWIDGPVRYIAGKEDARQFRALTADDDRALFIERFWSRRDPSPETLVNEYRSLFWQRVREANATFHGSTRPGWMTDRGKIYILYGPPTEKQEHQRFHSDTSIPGGGRGLIRWIYEGRPGGRVDLDAVTVVAFVRDYSGEYRLSYDPELSSVFFQAAMDEDRRFERWAEMFLSPARSELAVMLDLGKLQEVPPQEQVILESIETVESYRTQPLAAQLSRYRHPDHDERLAVVTVNLSAYGERSNPALIAKFTPRDATLPPRVIGEGSFRVEGSALGRVGQGRTLLDPGVYDVMVLAADPQDVGTAIYRGVLVIPEPAAGLELSDVTLAAEIDPLPYAALASHDEPFLLGPFRVVPRLAPTLPRGDSVDVFFEVYGGVGPYRVSYQLQGRDVDGSWVDLGRPQVTENPEKAQAWGVSTAPGWPLGEYRVRISVEDAAGNAVSSQLPFSLRDGEAG